LYSVHSGVEIKNCWICNSTTPTSPRDVGKNKFILCLYKQFLEFQFIAQLSFVHTCPWR